jgi:hypothetical protein
MGAAEADHPNNAVAKGEHQAVRLSFDQVERQVAPSP